MTTIADMMATGPAAHTTDAARLKFTTDRAAMVDALTAVGLAVPKRPTVPMLGGALLQAGEGQLTISATDFDTTVTVRVPGIVDTPGALLLDHGEIAKLLGALVKGTRKRDADALPVTVRTLDDGTPVLDLGGYTMPVTAYRVQDYPEIPDVAATLAQVDTDAFTRDMARVMVAVGKDPVRPALTGISVEISSGRVTLAGMDGYRLAVAPLTAVSEARTAGNVRALVPGHAAAQAIKRFTADRVRIGFDNPDVPSAVSFTCGDVTVSVRALCGEFPAYEQLLPDTAACVVRTDRAGLLSAARRAAAALDAKRQGGPLAMTITNESVAVAPVLDEQDGAVKAPVQPATVVGSPATVRIGFNPARLADALDSFTGDTVTLHTQTGAHRPVLLTDAAEDLTDRRAFRHLLMPSRLPEN